jgi:hypothetical protein
MIIVTPEFHRQLWLNFSAFRLISMPFIMSLIVFTVAMSDPERWQANIFIYALYSYYICVFIWGNYVVAHTASNEVNIKTWDFQRMSSIGPWELTIGKLFGATSYVWYTGILLLSLIAYCYHYADDNVLKGTFIDAFSSPTELVIFLVLTGIMGHAISFWATSSNAERKNSTSSASFVLGCAASYGILYFVKGTDAIRETTIYWHSWEIDKNTFVILSLLYFVFWTIIALQRDIRGKLQFKNFPFVLLVFLISFCLYITGCFSSKIMGSNISANLTAMDLKNHIVTFKLFGSYMIFAFSTYALVFGAAYNLSKYKRCIYAFKGKEWKRFFQNVPTWVGCAVLLLFLYFAMIIQTNIAFPQQEQSKTIFAFITAILFFIARDGLIYHSLLIGKIERHKFFLIFMYIIMMYLILPSSLSALAYSFAGNDARPVVASFFYPMISDNVLMTIMPVIYQTIMALTILYFVVKGLKDEQSWAPVYKIEC